MVDNRSFSLFLKQPIAHRGLHGLNRPENSLAALKFALEAKVPVELDLGLTRDHHWMLAHWPLYRTQEGKLRALAYSSKQQVKQAWPEQSSKHIVSLEDTLNFVQGRIPLLLDVKLYSFARAKKALMELMHHVAAYEKKYGSVIAVQSHNPLLAAAFNAHEINVPKGWIVGGLGKLHNRFIPPGKWPSQAALKYMKPDFLAVDQSISRTYFDFLKHQIDVPLLAFTIKNRQEADAISLYVDNIIADPFQP
jgi:glycerophosphoryl diester phosphodiesterase